MSRETNASHRPPSSVLQAYFSPNRLGPIQWLGNAGGFSGTQLWRFGAEDSQWCLRRWPSQHPSVEKLAWIHRVLKHAADGGVDFLPVPRDLADGRTFYGQDGHLWEVSAWMPGHASYWSEPSDEKLAAALQGLARFHLAARDLFHRQQGPAPGLIDRRDQLAGWLRDQHELRIDSRQHPEIAEHARQALQIMSTLYGRCAAQLDRGGQVGVESQPCIRDIWHDHALFVGSKLTGFVDFGAMRVDSVVIDIARLLGSLVEDDPRGWQVGLLAYEQLRPLNVEEKSLLATIDLANVVLSTANWIRWLFIDQRKFEDMSQVRIRIERLLGRLRRLADVGLK